MVDEAVRNSLTPDRAERVRRGAIRVWELWSEFFNGVASAIGAAGLCRAR
jgi:hypothetical protein